MPNNSNILDSRILVVDDSQANLDLISKIFRDHGFLNYEMVSESNLAIESIKRFSPDLICLDLNMPAPDGFQLLQEIQDIPKLQNIPIIMLTVQNEAKTRQKALQMGVSDFLSKPCDPTEVILRIKNQLKVHGLAQALKEKNSELESEVEARTRELLQTNKKLTKSEDSFRQIIEISHDGFISFDEEGRVLDWNNKAEHSFGYTKKEVFGATVWEIIIDAKDRATFQKKLTGQIQDFKLGIPESNFRLESTGERKSGETFPIELVCFHLPTENRLTFGAFLDDITERKLLHAQLNQAQKLESIGQLAAGIAHEINTPSQYINDNLTFILETISELEPLLKTCASLSNNTNENPVSSDVIRRISNYVQEIEVPYLLNELPLAISQSLEGMEKITKIVGAMKEYSHPGIEEKVHIDIHHAINTIITVSRNEWKYVANVETDFDPELEGIPCLGDQINQALLNLVINAAHAIDENNDRNEGNLGTIQIKTKKLDDWAEVRIKDNGGGIPEKIRQKIFDPFFTTKQVGKGTGQGLSIVHSVIVQKHQGELLFETELGQGTTFIIRLPLENSAVLH